MAMMIKWILPSIFNLKKKTEEDLTITEQREDDPISGQPGKLGPSQRPNEMNNDDTKNE